MDYNLKNTEGEQEHVEFTLRRITKFDVLFFFARQKIMNVCKEAWRRIIFNSVKRIGMKDYQNMFTTAVPGG